MTVRGDLVHNDDDGIAGVVLGNGPNKHINVDKSAGVFQEADDQVAKQMPSIVHFKIFQTLRTGYDMKIV